jgi:hypothetical protein
MPIAVKTQCSNQFSKYFEELVRAGGGGVSEWEASSSKGSILYPESSILNVKGSRGKGFRKF